MSEMYQDFMDYVNFDYCNWTIKEDAPDWAKKEFEEYIKEKQNNKDIK
jgi:hypothetical protein